MVYLNALTGTAAVCGHHHRVGPGVLDNVLPVDGVSVTQELVLVNVHATAQDLCGERDRRRGLKMDLTVVKRCFMLASFTNSHAFLHQRVATAMQDPAGRQLNAN